jgi:hypothetical protein
VPRPIYLSRRVRPTSQPAGPWTSGRCNLDLGAWLRRAGRGGLSSLVEREVKNDDELCAIRLRAW